MSINHRSADSPLEQIFSEGCLVNADQQKIMQLFSFRPIVRGYFISIPADSLSNAVSQHNPGLANSVVSILAKLLTTCVMIIQSIKNLF
tara:strand:+ start:70 stop:336 length:267 start_codon:yes stop_codon:yes gene_type:complete